MFVYPRPAAEEIMPVWHSDGRKGEGKNRGAEDDDFQGLRPYCPGDPLQHISWKASARGQGLFTKEFAGTGGATAWLDWDAVAGPDPERKLALLCYAVLQLSVGAWNTVCVFPAVLSNRTVGNATKKTAWRPWPSLV